MVSSETTSTVPVEGAELYVERRGSGPALLFIAGGLGDGGYYSDVAAILANEYTTLTYDRRGNSRSPLRGSIDEFTIARQTADAVAVIDYYDIDSAFVFGNSGGAIIGLDLVAHQPHRVTALVAHEPPIMKVVPDLTELQTFYNELEEVIVRDGVEPARARFVTRVGRAENVVRPDDLMARLEGNWDFFMRTEFRGFVDYAPDFGAINRGGVPVVTAGGSDSRAYHYYRAAEAIAARLGCEFVEFPGHHNAYLDVPDEFAGTLRSVLERMT